MARRPAYTFLFIKSDLIARADFGPAPQLAPLGFWELAQSGNARLFHSLEMAIGLGGKCGKSVWVVGEAFWTQTLSLPATALAGLTREQIAKAIGFDVEALTGLTGADSALGFCKAAPPDQSEHLWVTQVPLAARAQIQTAVESAGGTLGGIIHPGGLRDPLIGATTLDPSSAWRRIEVWKDTTFCLTGRNGDAERLTIINGDPVQNAWRDNVSRWIAANPADHSEWIGPQGSFADEGLGENGWDVLPALAGPALKGWLGRWAAKLVDGGAEVAPIVEPSRASKLKQRQYLAIAAVVILCLMGCILHGWELAGERAVAQNQKAAYTKEAAEKNQKLKQLQAPKQEWDRLQLEARGLRADLANRRAERAHMTLHAIPDFALQRHRLEDLLGQLAKNGKPDLMIDQIIAGSGGEMSIEGKCFAHSSIDALTESLASSLPAVGWQISPAERKPAGLIPAGQFNLRVTPLSQSKNPDAPDEIIPSSSLAGGVK